MELRFYVNDKLVVESQATPTTTLLYYLRDQLGLTGTKEGCNEGDCGACTVILADPHAPGGPRLRAVNSCLILLPMVHGKRVYTVEGLAHKGALHPVQSQLIETAGSQCGYCTPGVVMSMVEACYRTDLEKDWQLDDQMCGNLCRCTGYRPIKDAIETVAGTCPEGELSEALKTPLPVSAGGFSYELGEGGFHAPASFVELFELLSRPGARIVAGGTDLGLEVTKQYRAFECLVSLENLEELRGLTIDDEGLHIGAGVRLADLETQVQTGWPPLGRMLRFFGARQIKNRATIAGNLCTASPVGDMAPVLIALGAQVTLRSARGDRTLALEKFITGYRQTELDDGEILLRVDVPVIPETARAVAYKVSKRQELDISTVSAGFFVELDADGCVSQARLAYGGMAARPGARARHVEELLCGQPWNEESIEAALEHFDEDFTPIDDHRGSAWYRRTVAMNLLRGFFEETRRERLPELPYRPTATVQLEAVE